MASLQQAVDLHRAGRLREAERAYRNVLAAQPRQPDALSLLGVVLEALGEPQQAVGYIRKAVALDPKAPLFRLHLGNALQAAGDVSNAAVEFRAAVRLQPQLAEAQYNLGNALRLLEDKTGAIAAYRACLAQAPQAHEAAVNLALLVSAQGGYDEAFALLEKVLTVQPQHLLARVTYANIADEAQLYDISFREAQAAIQIDPANPDALFALALAQSRQPNEAAACHTYRQLVTVKPDHYAAWDNLAQLEQAFALHAEAEQAYQRALALAPNDPTINYHCALFDLLHGRLAQGFAGYDWRFQAVKKLKRIPHPTAPLWDGSDPRGKTILVVDEQGFGDSIMFCRYLPVLRGLGARVVYACRTPLQALLRGHWDGADEYVLLTEAVTTPCDAFAMMMDLPHLLRGMKGDADHFIPASVPYLPVPFGEVPASLTTATRLKVGVAWAGNRDHKHDFRRSIPFDVFAALFGVAGVQFYNLLRPADLRGDEATRFADLGIVDLGTQITDFAATARCMAALDLVIAVDTSTVHLAGALGKPVWVLLPLGPDWRWQTGRTDSPWYQTARLYRQNSYSDWATVLQQVRQDVAALATARG